MKPVAASDFKQAMRYLAGAVTIVTTGSGEERRGLTATAVCSLSADPPRVIACINRNGITYEMISKSRKLGINILSAAHQTLAMRFAGMMDIGDVDRFGVGDAETVDELGVLAEPPHEVADLGAAAVDDDGAHADEAHQDDVFGEEGEGVVVGGAGERVPPVLDDDDLAGEATDVGQRLDEDRRLERGAVVVAAHGATPTLVRPADSSRPSATLAACTAPPDAPLARLSRAPIATMVSVRSS